jgi:hypothetical protein
LLDPVGRQLRLAAEFGPVGFGGSAGGFLMADDDERTETGDIAPIIWRQLAKPHVEAIRAAMKRVAGDAAAIGKELTAVKKIVPAGRWGEWLRANFGLSTRMATTFMRVHDMAARLGSENFSALPIQPSALYLMARDDASDATRDELIATAKAGTPVTHAMAKKKFDEALAAQKTREGAQTTPARTPAPSDQGTAKFFDEPQREIDDDRLDVYDRAMAVLDELKSALPPSATQSILADTDDDSEMFKAIGVLENFIRAAYWEVLTGERPPTDDGTDREPAHIPD